ncbi:hypothetical protein Mterra_02181 [Calidithermus terrae]|uniref:Pycsar effector protein domain-containing protein n=1 Tax=Calidithermus terrae TaxID=1408545 RepID=A0A399EKZ8_9DEIN|nr:Pycsar system effector family protein [Calidithermus terrae]RIH83769.1 hypothetical protein Mterra_02181 [Calidithermus terrae]
MTRTDHVWQIRDALDADVQFADAKAEFIIGLAALGAGLLAAQPPGLPTWKAALTGLTGFLLLGAIVCAVLSVRPRTAGRRRGTVFWGHVAAFKDPAAYREALEHGDLLEEVARQVFEVARVARRKYALVAYATNFLSGGLLVLWVGLVWAG